MNTHVLRIFILSIKLALRLRVGHEYHEGIDRGIDKEVVAFLGRPEKDI